MRVPQFKDPEVTKFLVEMDREMQRIKQDALSKVSANTSALLFAPDRSVWEVKVDNAGALTTTKVAG